MARERLSFSTCNLYNLNQPGLPVYSGDGWTPEEYDRKIAWLGSALGYMYSDVFGFQELWHKDALSDALVSAGLDQTHAALVPDGHAGQGIVCAAAVRSDWLAGDPQWISAFPDDFILQSRGDDPQTAEISVQIDSFSRPVLHFKIQPVADHRPISVYVCHLKSKAPTNVFREDWYDRDTHSRFSTALGSAISTIRRTAEAAALRMILIDAMRGNDEPVVVLGDINDETLSNTANLLTGQPNYLLGLSSGGGDAALYTAQTLQQYRSTRDVYYTHIHQNERSSLDHILVSQEFYDNSKRRIWSFQGLDILNDHLNEDRHKETGTTDHGIVRAHFQLQPA